MVHNLISIPSKDVKALYDYLGALLGAKAITEKIERLNKLPKINDVKPRVFKRTPEMNNPEQFSANRPWTCTGVFQDARRTCYTTFEDAIAWAVMPDDERQIQLEYDAKSEMGQ